MILTSYSGHNDTDMTSFRKIVLDDQLDIHFSEFKDMNFHPVHNFFIYIFLLCNTQVTIKANGPCLKKTPHFLLYLIYNYLKF